MDSENISETGLRRIFAGEVFERTRRDGVKYQDLDPFRFVDDELIESLGHQVIESQTVPADERGVWRGRVKFHGAQNLTSRSSFFPREWTRQDVLRAIAEAYANRTPKDLQPGKVAGIGGGLKIDLWLNKHGLIEDACPRHSVTNAELLTWKIERGSARRSKHHCPVCDARKQNFYLCPSGHNASFPATGWNHYAVLINKFLRGIKRRWHGLMTS